MTGRDRLIDAWAEAAGATCIDGSWRLGRGQVWPSEAVLAILDLILTPAELLAALAAAQTSPWNATPRDLAIFYWRCHDAALRRAVLA